MKAATVLFILSTILLGGVCTWQFGQLRRAEARAQQLRRQLETANQARSEEQRRANALDKRQAALTEQSYELAGIVAALRASGANTNAPKRDAELLTPGSDKEDEEGPFSGKKMGQWLSKMMKDPAMKEMMRSQQKLSINMMYGSLFKEMPLTSEERSKFSELLLDEQMKSLELGEKALSGGVTNAATVAEQTRESESELKALLGEERFAQYQNYKKEMGERMQVDEFRKQLEGTDAALQEGQTKQLVRLMREEGEQAPLAISQDPTELLANLDTALSGDMMEKQMQRQEEINRRVLERARDILTPAQLKAYGDYQTQQLNIQRIGLKMSREMFGAKSKGNSP
ncbi:MAG TPA: hypothetical protein VK615_14115 [Candidatus Binatia bacterium]|nr:hypothetical protein [Candidatus Binatia bacterium]